MSQSLVLLVKMKYSYEILLINVSLIIKKLNKSLHKSELPLLLKISLYRYVIKSLCMHGIQLKFIDGFQSCLFYKVTNDGFKSGGILFY